MFWITELTRKVKNKKGVDLKEQPYPPKCFPSLNILQTKQTTKHMTASELTEQKCTSNNRRWRTPATTLLMLNNNSWFISWVCKPYSGRMCSMIDLRFHQQLLVGSARWFSHVLSNRYSQLRMRSSWTMLKQILLSSMLVANNGAGIELYAEGRLSYF